MSEQFEQFCSSVGSQPCTCYHPDNRNVPKFELSTDPFTGRASGVNGSGPASCQDLQILRHNLSGFYMVRFNTKRIKTIFCELNNATTTEAKNQEKIIDETSEKESNVRILSKSIRFCGGVRSNQCTYLYSDHPDALLHGKNRNKEPTNCKDLHIIGHNLIGFYMVRLNAIKVKIIYCDFLNITAVGHNTETRNMIQSNTTYKNKSESPMYCNGLGSQPCSCYYSNTPNILQFELSNDEITRKALSENGTGPASCSDLESIGYTFDGFYIVRSDAKTMKIIFCKFNQAASKPLITLPTLLPIIIDTVKTKPPNKSRVIQPKITDEKNVALSNPIPKPEIPPGI